MSFRTPFLLCFAIVVLVLAGAKPAHQLESIDALPDGVPAPIAAVLEPKGHALAGPDGKLVQIWLVKGIDLQPGFQPAVDAKYPFQSGQLIGLLNVEKKTRYQDFRAQRVRSGMYTLRYGKQPQDGNHIGTSELSDYLVAIPIAVDKTPDAIAPPKKLHESSAKTTRGTHPAVFNLLPVEKPSEQPVLENDESREWWILSTTANGKEGDKSVKVPMRLVLVGKTEAE